MSLVQPLLLLALSVALLMGVIVAVRLLGQRFGWQAEVSRKSVHVAIGLYAMILPLLFREAWPVVLLLLIALALMVWLRLPHVRTGGLGATIHTVERRSAGDIWLALAIGFVFLRSEGQYILYGLPIAIITLSDTAAALTGSSYGRRRFEIESGVKSWEGVIAFFMVSTIVAMTMLLLLTDTARLSVVLLALAIATFGATVEAVLWRGLDNLFVPIGIHFFLKGFLAAPTAELVTVSALFLAALLAAALVSRPLGLSRHAGRTLVIAVFLFLGVSGPFGAIAPGIAAAAHLAARRHPCASAHRDLDFIATIGAVGLIWFFIGETMGRSAIALFTVGIMGVATGLLLIAAAPGLWRITAAAVLGGTACLGLLFYVPSWGGWVTGLPLVVAISTGLVLLAYLARPGAFDRWRTPRLAAVANLVPLSAYFLQMSMP